MGKKTTDKKKITKAPSKKKVVEEEVIEEENVDEDVDETISEEEAIEIEEDDGEEDEEDEDDENESSEEQKRLSQELIKDLQSYGTTPENLQKIIQTVPVVIVDFWAEWCGPCLMMAHLMKGIFAPYMKFHPNVRYVTINTDEFNDYGGQEKINGIPAFKVYVNGKKQTFEDKEQGQTDMLVGSTPMHFGTFLRICEEYEHQPKTAEKSDGKKK